MALARLLVGATAFGFAFTGASMLFAPDWFFANLGPIAPYNRHYLGASGASLLALGAGLGWALRDLARYRPIVAVGALAAWLHVINHAFDVASARAAVVAPADIAVNVAPSLAAALALTIGAILVGRRRP